MPILSKKRFTPSTWIGSPLCDAQASAKSRSSRSNCSTAPLSNRASACNDLIAERGKIGCSISPALATILPLESAMQNAARWRFSTQLPRVNSTRTGFAVFCIEYPYCCLWRFLVTHSIARRAHQCAISVIRFSSPMMLTHIGLNLHRTTFLKLGMPILNYAMKKKLRRH